MFGTPEFAATWWRHFGQGEPQLLACRAGDGRLVALWPLYRRRRGPLRLMRAIGHGCGDELSLVCRRRHRLDALAALEDALGSRSVDGDLLVLDLLPIGAGEIGTDESRAVRRLSESGWDRVDHRVLVAERCPVLVAPDGGWEELLQSRSRNFRQQVRRRERQLCRDNAVDLHLVSDPDELTGAMEELFRLHQLRFDRRESNTFAPARRRFHLDWAAVCLEREWLRLWALRIDGVTVAAWYGFRFGDAESFYQSGRDPKWQADSVGFVLLAHTIRAALGDGVCEYRFLRGGEAYKSRFSDEMSAVATVAVPLTTFGSIAVSIGGRLRSRR